MFKVLLVDDEEEVRSGIKDRIDWNQFNLVACGEAENGREALEFFDEVIPDIVITDINMPFMDGLELAEKIKEGFPTVKVVILTGFDDFKFAQTAIKHGVRDYILKPVLPADINALLEKLNNQLLEEINEKEDVEKLRKYFSESLPVIRENFLMSLILGKSIIDDMDLINESDVALDGKWFTSAICKIDSESISGMNLSGEEVRFKRFSIFNIINEVLEKHGSGEAFMYDDGIVIILPSNSSSRPAARNQMIDRLDEMRRSVERFTDLTVSIGMGRIVQQLNQIRESYLSAVTARKYKTILSGNKVIFVEDLEPGIGGFFHLDEKNEDHLVSSIKFGDESKVREAVDCLFGDFVKQQVSMQECQLYFTEVVSTLMKLARLFKIDLVDIFPGGSGMFMEFDRFNSIDQARDWVFDFSFNLMKSIKEQRQDASQILYEKAVDYINENYSDAEMNVQKLSNHLFISPSYMNLIFKRKSGDTFLKNLTAVRFEKARELLNDKSIKIAEVAERVGYPDVSYFSYFFKKKTGISPREYRKSLEEEAVWEKG
ncbi:MAG: response regulator [Clostridia bacterium]|nr:response regulator [Clostridia bacterium]MBN2881894.1 response regulator [Clostridia bacterium]